MIGETQSMQELRKNIERLAALDCTVIIRGETGTGKELAARLIHNSSVRKNKRQQCGHVRMYHARALGNSQDSRLFAVNR